jgi:glycerol uptake facilitator-like aquaporin
LSIAASVAYRATLATRGKNSLPEAAKPFLIGFNRFVPMYLIQGMTPLTINPARTLTADVRQTNFSRD